MRSRTHLKTLFRRETPRFRAKAAKPDKGVAIATPRRGERLAAEIRGRCSRKRGFEMGSSFFSRGNEKGFTPTPKFFGVSSRSERGFTLFELIVGVAITAILSSLLIVYGSGGRVRTNLNIERAKIGQIILRAKSLTISTYNRPPIPCGYGLHLDYVNNSYSLVSYIIYDPVDNSETPECNALKNGGGIDVSLEEVVDGPFPLTPGVIFGTGNERLDDLIFTPPEPRTFLFTDGNLNSPAQGVSAKIYLTSPDPSVLITLGVSEAGQISF